MRFFPILLLLIACRSEPQRPENPSAISREVPATGTVVAEESEQHTGDGLNRFTFRVKVTKAPERGVYNVHTEDGPNKGETQFTLPKGAEDYAVSMRKTGDATRMEIGFHAPGDTTFYPYYEVASEGKTIRAQYTRAYRLE